MKVVMVLVVRDAADVLEAQLLFHLNAGVDLVLILDEGSVDDTPGIIERFEQEGRVRPTPTAVGVSPRSHMTRLAATEYGADWVIPAAAGEFWWPHGGNLEELLSQIAPRYNLVQALVRPFPPVQDAEGPFHERMVYRLSAQAQIGDPRNPLRPARKFAHRPAEDVVVDETGLIRGSGLRPLRGWYPIEVLSFPFRSEGQRALDSARTNEDYAALALDRSEIEEGTESGTVRVDTRLRDALRSLHDGKAIEFPRPTLVESALYAVDSAVLGELDVVATQQRLDELEERLGSVEANVGIRLERKLRSFVKRSRTVV